MRSIIDIIRERPALQGRSARLHLALGVALVAFLVYLPALQNDFLIWDDDNEIINNLRLRSLNGELLRWAFSETLDYWRPIVWISHAIDYALWGLNPAGFHLTSIILHALNAFLVVWLAVMLVEISFVPPGPSPLPSSSACKDAPTPHEHIVLITAGITGMLFAVHPVHVESVAWISTRTDLLCSLFYLLGLLAYVRYADAARNRSAGSGVGSVAKDRCYLIALACFILALASKPLAVTLPAVLLLLDWYPLQRLRTREHLGRLIVEKAPFWVLGLCAAGLAYWGQKELGTLASLEAVSLPDRLLVASRSLVDYLRAMAMPITLVPYYPFPRVISPLSFEYALPVVLVTGTTIFCLRVAKYQKMFLAIWAFYLITLLPMLGIIKARGVAMADRFAYLPSIGPFLIIALMGAWFWNKAGALRVAAPVFKRVAAGMTLCLCVVLSAMTVKQTAIWKDSIRLWNYVIEQEPDRVPLAYTNRGLAFKQEGERERALTDLSTALSLDPFDQKAYYNRALLYKDLGKSERAIEDFTAAIALGPIAVDSYTAYVNAHIGRAILFDLSGQADAAIKDYNRAIALNHSSGDAYLNRGVAWERMGQHERAFDDLSRALELDPGDYLAFGNRGMVLGKMGRIPEALADYANALALKPDFAEAYLGQGTLYRKAGSRERAAENFRRACDLGNAEGCDALKDVGMP